MPRPHLLLLALRRGRSARDNCRANRCTTDHPTGHNRKKTTVRATFYTFLLPPVNYVFGLLSGLSRSEAATTLFYVACDASSPRLLAAGSTLAGLPAGRRRPTPRHAALATTRPNVLLVTIDTLRADHVGCYGIPAASTPTLDALARRGVRFETAVAHAPLTGPSHASILTGQTPLGHGFRNNGGLRAGPDYEDGRRGLPEAGLPNGGHRVGISARSPVRIRSRVRVYEDHLPRGNDPRRTPYVERPRTPRPTRRFNGSPRPAAGNRRRAVVPLGALLRSARALRAAGRRRGRASGRRRTMARSRSSIASWAPVAEARPGRGELARTIVLVTADHGESLGEHGEGTHGVFIYDATLRVPWIMAGPGISAQAASLIRWPARSTCCRRCSTTPRHSSGPAGSMADRCARRRGRAWAMRRRTPSRSIRNSSSDGRRFMRWRTARYKFIDAPHAELYDLERRCVRKANRARRAAGARRGPDAAGALQSALRRAAPAEAAATVDPEAAERLRSLGYVERRVHPRLRRVGPLRDPKDGMRFLPRLNRAMSAARIEPDVAIRELTAVIAEDPHLLMARRTRAVAYAAAGRHELAIADLRQLE